MTYVGEALEALLSHDLAEAIGDGLVELGVSLKDRWVSSGWEGRVGGGEGARCAVVTYLLAALDNVEGANGGVGDTAGHNASHHALEVVAGVVNVSHCVFF